MNPVLQKYITRSPRYTLSPDDNTLIRVAGPNQVPWEESTQIQNISLSGLCFTAPPELCPVVGEFIRIQFTIPGSAQTACFGAVTRCEKVSNSEVLVAVEFRKLDRAQRLALSMSLVKKLKGQLSNSAIKRSALRSYLATWTKTQVLLAVIGAALWALVVSIRFSQQF